MQPSAKALRCAFCVYYLVMSEHYFGSCLCGDIRYRVDGQLSDFGYCHCPSCRKASGSAHAANAGVLRKDFKLEDPHQRLREYESSPGKMRVFCGRCGSPIYAYLTDTSDIIRIRLGSLDTPLNKQAKAHTFVGSKASWDVIGDDLPQFEDWADQEVLIQLGSRQKMEGG